MKTNENNFSKNTNRKFPTLQRCVHSQQRSIGAADVWVSNRSRCGSAKSRSYFKNARLGRVADTQGKYTEFSCMLDVMNERGKMKKTYGV